MAAIFIRHKFKEPKLIDKLWDGKKIGLHYEDIASTNPEDYRTPLGKKKLARLQNYCLDGGIVGATYEGKRDKMLVGHIKAGSKIEPLPFLKNDGKRANLKTVNLVDHRELSIDPFL